MARNGKIARLPRTVREELNRRLDDGEPAGPLLAWLNGLAEVQTVLAAEFAGRPVNAQNLSDWRLGGFADWQRHQEARDLARDLTAEAAELADDAEGEPLTDRMSVVVAVALGRLLREVGQGGGVDQREAVLAIARELSRLRRGDHEADTLRRERADWEEAGARRKVSEAVLAEALRRTREQFGVTGLSVELTACLEAAKRYRAAAPARLNQAQSR